MNTEQLGGRYTAKQNADGTLDIFNVPIVSELAKGERADLPDFEITSDWLKAALARANTRGAGGYLPPLHVHHHDDGPPKPRAGYFRPMKVGALDLGGRKVQTLFADFLRIPADVGMRIMRGELPYRSVEILNVNSEPEVDSLALLDSQPPQFRYPLLSIAKLIKQDDPNFIIPQLAASSPRTAAVAFAAFAEHSAAAVFNFGGSTVADEDKDKKDEELKAAAGDEGAPAWATKMMASLDAIAASLTAMGTAKAAAVIEGEPHKEPDGDECEAQRLADASKGEEGKPKFLDPTMAESLVAKAISGVEKKFTAALATSAGEVAGLKAQLADRAKKDTEREGRETVKHLIFAARRELKDHNVPEEVYTESLPKFAALGQDALDSFVASLKATAPRDPVSFEALAEMSNDDSPAVAKFQGSAAKMADARQLVAAFKAAKARGHMLPSMTEERYLAIHMPQESVA